MAFLQSLTLPKQDGNITYTIPYWNIMENSPIVAANSTSYLNTQFCAFSIDTTKTCGFFESTIEFQDTAGNLIEQIQITGRIDEDNSFKDMEYTVLVDKQNINTIQYTQLSEKQNLNTKTIIFQIIFKKALTGKTITSTKFFGVGLIQDTPSMDDLDKNNYPAYIAIPIKKQILEFGTENPPNDLPIGTLYIQYSEAQKTTSGESS